jgi:hypothetical protein
MSKLRSLKNESPTRRKGGSAHTTARKLVRTFTATALDLLMLEAVSRYHGFSKSATLTSLLRKEFWRVFPGGTPAVRPDPGARIAREGVTS